MAGFEGRAGAVREWLGERFPALVDAYDVPGAVAGVLVGGQVIEASAGVVNMRTGVPATDDSVFQIGSITKLWTGVLIHQLIDEGLVDLDLPVRAYLPEFAVADPDASGRITVRQLLCHTGGFEGDIFTATTIGEDAVQRFVEDVVPTLEQHFAPGELYSYSNAGYVVLGRIIEVVRGLPWQRVLTERLVEPLGLEHVAPSADEAVLYRTAIGHVRARPDAPIEPTKTYGLVASNAPVGARLAMSVGDLLEFARMCLNGGTAADGTRVVSERAMRAMLEPQVEQPPFDEQPTSRGLAWTIFDWEGGRVVGHNGGTIGQSAYFRMVPGHDVAVALLTNGGKGTLLYQDVFGHVLKELAGIVVPSLPMPPVADPAPVGAPTANGFDRYVGRYEVQLNRMDVESVDGRLWLTRVRKQSLSENDVIEPERLELLRLDGDRFITAEAPWGVHDVYIFGGDDAAGQARYLHTSRAVPRI